MTTEPATGPANGSVTDEATGPAERVLVLAPLGRDAELLCRALSEAGLPCAVPDTVSGGDLSAQLDAGVGVLLLTEEALTPATLTAVRRTAETQPDWSDLPLVLLVGASWSGLGGLGDLSAATVLERPLRIPTLVTVVRAALTARKRQYQVRDLLRAQDRANVQLEARVGERTLALRTANTQLQTEVAEHERAKQQLLGSERRFEQAFRVGPVATCLTTRHEGRFLDVNLSFEKLTGYTAAEAVGQTNRTLGMWASPEDQAKVAAALRAENYHELELQFRTKAGSVRDILASAASVEMGDVPCLLHMFYDITERKQTEEELTQAIGEVMQDAAWFSRSLMEKLAQARTKRSGGRVSAAEVASLTKREKQVLEQIASGRSNDAIAADLGLAEQTVRNYITNLYDKLGVHSRAEAVIWARERGFASF